MALIVDELALLEIEDAAEYYERERPGLGIDFDREIDGRLDLIEVDPLIGSRVRGMPGVLRLVPTSGRFPHILVYFTAEDGDVHVVACMHPRREPTYWQHRVKR